MTTSTQPNPAQTPTASYVTLVAALTSMVALATDIMLPALDVIARDLGAPTANDAHAVVTVFFFGFAVGQLVVGPLSDTYGRRPVILVGFALFVLACLAATVTQNWWLLLVARALQGVAVAGPRVVVIAMVRDAYEGRAMARVMSIVMTVFILVPIIAPSLGQGLIWLGGWRASFVGLGLLACAAALWFALVQEETLAPEARRPFRAAILWTGTVEILRSRAAMGYTLGAGLIFGAFIAYLGSAQQIFAVVYDITDLFPLYFALAAVSLGAASILNARLVMTVGMRRMTWMAIVFVSLLSVGFALVTLTYAGIPPLWVFMAWLLGIVLGVGIIFANFNALAMEPLGHMAGLGAAFVGSFATLTALPLAALISQRFDGTITPLVAGFAILGTATMLVMLWATRGRPNAA